MTLKQYLAQYEELLERMKMTQNRIRRMRMEADALSSVWGEHISAHNHEASYVRLLEKIDEAEHALDRDVGLEILLREQMEKCFAALPNHRLRWTVEYIYLEGRSYRETGELLFVDKTTVFRWCEKAREMLEVPEDPVDINAEEKTE